MSQKTKGVTVSRRKKGFKIVHGGKCSGGSDGRRQHGRWIRAAESKTEVALAFNSEWQFERTLFLNERSWNVIENKGPLWKTFGRSWNVIENTGT
jgi:hypothetical protein